MAERKYRRAINFDLYAKKIDQTLQGGHQYAYSEIRKFFQGKGFERSQFSGYVSKGSLSRAEINDIIFALGQEFPWLKNAVRKIEVTSILRRAQSHGRSSGSQRKVF